MTSLLVLMLAACAEAAEPAPPAPLDEPEPRPGIAANGARTCIVNREGVALCAGDENHDAPGFRPVGASRDVTQAVAGPNRACLLHRTGRVSCSDDGGAARPEAIGRLENVVAIAGGGPHTCALHEDGSVSCWGAGRVLGRAEERVGPSKIRDLPPSRELAVGGSHACAIARDGTVHCWGEHRALGDGFALRAKAVPIAGIRGARAIAGASSSACAVVGEAVRCWGADPELEAAVARTARVAGGSPIAIALSIFQHCVLGSEGRIACARGQHEPARIEGVENATALAIGDRHGCAVAGDRVWCWGERRRGQLGDPIAESHTPVDAGLEGIVRLRGGDAIVAIGADGRAHRFGDDGFEVAASNADGFAVSDVEQCWLRERAASCVHLDRHHEARSEPTAHPELGEVADLVIDGTGGTVLDTQGRVSSWHYAGGYGGSAPPDLPLSSRWSAGETVAPFQLVAHPLAGALEIAVADGEVCGRDAAGDVTCVARGAEPRVNFRGASAIAGTRRHLYAIVGGEVLFRRAEGAEQRVEGIEGATALGVGERHGCARLGDGRAMCWGDNGGGELGGGFASIGHTAAVMVGGDEPLRGIAAIAVASLRSCALLDDRSVRCWGFYSPRPPPPTERAIEVAPR